jgi:hypothetical protein
MIISALCAGVSLVLVASVAGARREIERTLWDLTRHSLAP